MHKTVLLHTEMFEWSGYAMALNQLVSVVLMLHHVVFCCNVSEGLYTIGVIALSFGTPSLMGPALWKDSTRWGKVNAGLHTTKRMHYGQTKDRDSQIWGTSKCDLEFRPFTWSRRLCSDDTPEHTSVHQHFLFWVVKYVSLVPDFQQNHTNSTIWLGYIRKGISWFAVCSTGRGAWFKESAKCMLQPLESSCNVIAGATFVCMGLWFSNEHTAGETFITPSIGWVPIGKDLIEFKWRTYLLLNTSLHLNHLQSVN